MPITQERFIKIIAHADALLKTFDELKQNVKTNAQAAAALVNAHSTLQHTPAGPQHETITELTDALSQLYHMMTETEVPLELRKDLIIEQEHFKKHRKANEVLAIYKYRKRHSDALMAQSVAQIPQFFPSEPSTQPTPPTPELKPETLREDPNLQKMREEMTRREALNIPLEERMKRRQEAIARGEAAPDEFDSNKKPNDAWTNTDDARPATPEEIEAANKAENEASAPSKHNKVTKGKVVTGIKQRDGTIVDMPSAEEMKELGKIPSGVSVL